MNTSERIGKHQQILCRRYFGVTPKISVGLLDYNVGISLAGYQPPPHPVNAEVLQSLVRLGVGLL